jgi:LPXTG-motif cell wall-anchored protein
MKSVVVGLAFLVLVLGARAARADRCLVTNQSCGTDPCYPNASPIGIGANCTFAGPFGNVYATDQFGFPWDCSCPTGDSCGYVAGDGAGGQCCQSAVTCPSNSCGYVPNGCVGMGIWCGNCATGQTCFGSSCCTPTTTCPAGACGGISNGCGGTLQCGGCPTGQTCSSNQVCVAPARVPAAPAADLAALGVGLLGIGGWLVSRRRKA